VELGAGAIVAILTAIISFFLADAGWGAIPLAAVGFPATLRGGVLSYIEELREVIRRLYHTEPIYVETAPVKKHSRGRPFEKARLRSSLTGLYGSG
jgi:hypothetical protein